MTARRRLSPPRAVAAIRSVAGPLAALLCTAIVACDSGTSEPTPAPVVSVEATDATASEVGPDNGRFTLQRTGSTGSPLTVTVAFSGSATAGEDYQTLPTSVTFSTGQSTADVVVIPIPDAAQEGTETVVLTVNPGDSHTLGTLSASVSIADPTVSVVLATSAVTVPVFGGGTPSRLDPIAVTSSGQALTGVSVGTIVFESGAQGWVTSATLDVSTTPASLQVVADPGQLAPGEHTARIPVTAAGAGLAFLRVTLRVLAAPPGTIWFERNAAVPPALLGLDPPADVDVWRMASNGAASSLVRLTTDPTFDGRPGVRPDGGTVVFRSLRSGNSDLWSMAGNGGGTTQLTNTPLELDSWPSWIDNNFFVYSATDPADAAVQRLKVFQASPSNCTVCPTGFAAPSLGLLQSHPGASTTTRLVAFTTNHHTNGGSWDVWTWDWGTNVLTNLTQNAASHDFQATFSPDGSKIAFTSLRTGEEEIFVMNADGSNVRQVTTRTGSRAVWSPDGARIAYMSSRSGRWDIYVINADGSDDVNVTNTPDVDEGGPAWR